MPLTSTQTITIIPPRTSGGSLKNAANLIIYEGTELGKSRHDGDGGREAGLWGAVGRAFRDIQSQVDGIANALRAPVALPDPIQITDPAGNLVCSLGHTVDPNTNVNYPGIWASAFYSGGTGPGSSTFYASGGGVFIGANGVVEVLDPYSNVGAWLGTQSEASQNVSGAVNNGSGAIRLTVTAHGYRNGDWVNVASVGGVPNATGQWVIAVITANTFDLLTSTFSGTYTSGGTVQRFFSGGAFETLAVAAGQRITNVANNGSGLCRVTVTAHGYATGYRVLITNVQGTVEANGSWLVTVITANTFDLQSSTFTNAYVSGGIAINWPTAKLLAQGNGDLILNGATFTLNLNGVTTTIANQVVGSLTGFAGLKVADNSTTALAAVLAGSGVGTVYVQGSSATANGTLSAGASSGLLNIKDTSSNQSQLSSATLLFENSLLTVLLQLSASGGSYFPGNTGFGGNASPGFAVDATGDLNYTGHIRKAGTAISLTVNTNSTAVQGTAGAGQSNFVAVTSVTLNA